MTLIWWDSKIMQAVVSGCVSTTPFTHFYLSIFSSQTSKWSWSTGTQTFLCRPSNPVVLKLRQDLFLHLSFFQFTVSGFGGFLIGSLQYFVFGKPWADAPLTWHCCRPFLSLSQSIIVCPSVWVSSLPFYLLLVQKLLKPGHTLELKYPLRKPFTRSFI